jgi:hypothetical protein
MSSEITCCSMPDWIAQLARERPDESKYSLIFPITYAADMRLPEKV